MQSPVVNERPVMNFWPSDADPEVKKAFASHTSRMLWLGIKYQHIVDQHFNANCVQLGESLDQEIIKGTEITGVKLTIWLQNLGMLGTHDTFGDELLPYVLGEKNILWVYKNIDLDRWSSFYDRDSEEFQAGLI